jgi:hypothetical protein
VHSAELSLSLWIGQALYRRPDLNNDENLKNTLSNGAS